MQKVLKLSPSNNFQISLGATVLKESGFEIGEYFLVETEPGKIRLSKLPKDGRIGIGQKRKLIYPQLYGSIRLGILPMKEAGIEEAEHFLFTIEPGCILIEQAPDGAKEDQDE